MSTYKLPSPKTSRRQSIVFAREEKLKQLELIPGSKQDGTYEIAEAKLIASLLKLEAAAKADGLSLESLVCSPQDAMDLGPLRYLIARPTATRKLSLVKSLAA